MRAWIVLGAAALGLAASGGAAAWGGSSHPFAVARGTATLGLLVQEAEWNRASGTFSLTLTDPAFGTLNRQTWHLDPDEAIDVRFDGCLETFTYEASSADPVTFHLVGGGVDDVCRGELVGELEGNFLAYDLRLQIVY